jgi:hypothetical protein
MIIAKIEAFPLGVPFKPGARAAAQRLFTTTGDSTFAGTRRRSYRTLAVPVSFVKTFRRRVRLSAKIHRIRPEIDKQSGPLILILPEDFGGRPL